MPRASLPSRNSTTSTQEPLDLSSDEIVASYYDGMSVQAYDDNWGSFTQSCCEVVRQCFALQEDIPVAGADTGTQRRMLDVGGGTGSLTYRLIEGTNVQAVVVDPFLVKCQQDSDTLQFVKAPAEVFMSPACEKDAWWRTGYQQVLMKECIHFLDPQKRVSVLRGMYEGLQTLEGDVPALLIITRPPDSELPFWEDVWKCWGDVPVTDTLLPDIKRAGFKNVSMHTKRYPVSMPVTEWCKLVRKRFCSCLAPYTDEELEEGCRQLVEEHESKIDSEGAIHFEDAVVFITGMK